MAMDPRISLAVQPAGILQAAQQGLEFGQQYAQQEAMNPLQQEALKAQTGQAQAQTSQVQAETGKLDMAKQIAGAGYMAGAIKHLQQLPQEQRWPTAQLHLAKMQAMGLDTTGVDESHMSDEGLQQAYSAVAPMAQMAQQGQRQGLQSTGTPLIGVKNGNVVQIATTFNPNTGEYESKEIPTGLTDTQAANRSGMTAGAANQQAAERASLLGEVATQTAVNTITATSTPAAAAEGEKRVAGGAAQDKAEKWALAKDRGLAAAENLPNINRSLELLDELEKTGGVESKLTSVANQLGLKNATQGELKAILIKSMLGSLKTTFGAAPTEGERIMLGQAEASYEQSKDVSISLLKNAKTMAVYRVKYGLKAAQDSGDQGAYDQISEAQALTFGDKPTQPKATATPSPATARTPEAQAEYDRLRKEYQRP